MDVTEMRLGTPSDRRPSPHLVTFVVQPGCSLRASKFRWSSASKTRRTTALFSSGDIGSPLANIPRPNRMSVNACPCSRSPPNLRSPKSVASITAMSGVQRKTLPFSCHRYPVSVRTNRKASHFVTDALTARLASQRPCQRHPALPPESFSRTQSW